MRKPQKGLRHKPRPVLYDSGVVSRVLDDLFSGQQRGFVMAHLAVLATREVYISQTTLFELQPVVRVLRNRYPTKQVRIASAIADFEQLDLSSEIGEMAVSLKGGIEQLKFADATIAATALVHQMDLFTLNEADFAMIPGLRLYKPSNYEQLKSPLGIAK